MKTILDFKSFESKIIEKDTTAKTLNVKSLIQIVDGDDKNSGQGVILKALKTMYHIKYKSEVYKVKKSEVSMNVHGQAQSKLSDLTKK